MYEIALLGMKNIKTSSFFRAIIESVEEFDGLKNVTAEIISNKLEVELSQKGINIIMRSLHDIIVIDGGEHKLAFNSFMSGGEAGWTFSFDKKKPFITDITKSLLFTIEKDEKLEANFAENFITPTGDVVGGDKITIENVDNRGVGNIVSIDNSKNKIESFGIVVLLTCVKYLRYILAISFPPLAVILCDSLSKYLINATLWVIGIAGPTFFGDSGLIFFGLFNTIAVIHAILAVHSFHADKKAKKI